MWYTRFKEERKPNPAGLSDLQIYLIYVALLFIALIIFGIGNKTQTPVYEEGYPHSPEEYCGRGESC